MQRRKPFNHNNVHFNLGEAIEQLQKLQRKAKDEALSEVELQIGLLHAYHHLNFAWNTRRVSRSDYSKLMKSHLNRWGTYPQEIEEL